MKLTSILTLNIVLVAIMGVSGLLLTSNIHQLNIQHEVSRSQTKEFNEITGRLYRSLLDAETGQRGYLLTGDDSYLAPYFSGSADAKEYVFRLQKISENQDIEHSLNTIKDLVGAKLDELRQTIELYQAGLVQQSMDVVKGDMGKAYMDELRILIERILIEREAEEQQEIEQLQNLHHQQYVTTIASLVFFVLLAIVFFLLFKRELINPLASIKKATGNFDGYSALKFKRFFIKEVGQLGGTIEKMSETVVTTTSKLREKEKEALVAKETQSEFLANMSHEIRTPMNGVLGMLRLLEDTPLNEEQKHFAKQSRRSAVALLRIINDVLDVSKLESGKFEFSLSINMIEDLLNDVGKLMQSEAETKGLELLCPANWLESTPVHCDPVRVRQILLNLVGNAIKFTESGSVQVVVITEKDKQDDDKVKVNFIVSDTGLGIPQAQVEKIFDRFKQVIQPEQKKASGTGLGLNIVYNLVKMMNGEITLESEEGVGTTFKVSLVFDTAREVTLNNPGLTQHEKADTTVVACFAEPLYKRYLSECMTQWNVSFSFLNEIEKAIGTCRATSGEVVLVIDSQVSIDNHEKELRELSDNGVRLVMVSNLSTTPELELRQELADRLIYKPITPSELYNTVISTGANIAQKDTSNGNADNEKLTGEVLLVEDDATNQLVASALLGKLGLDFTVADDGMDAIEKLKLNKYDLVLMDCMMPVLDGYAATRRIRNGDAGEMNQEIPVIALTANALEGAAEQCFDAGMSAYLTKPIDPDSLYRKLRKYLPQA